MIARFCRGEHFCIICKIVYKCRGVDYGHTGSKGYLCNGPYQQFCSNHSVSDYRKMHIQLGEL